MKRIKAIVFLLSCVIGGASCDKILHRNHDDDTPPAKATPKTPPGTLPDPFAPVAKPQPDPRPAPTPSSTPTATPTPTPTISLADKAVGDWELSLFDKHCLFLLNLSARGYIWATVGCRDGLNLNVEEHSGVYDIEDGEITIFMSGSSCQELGIHSPYASAAVAFDDQQLMIGGQRFSRVAPGSPGAQMMLTLSGTDRRTSKGCFQGGNVRQFKGRGF